MKNLRILNVDLNHVACSMLYYIKIYFAQARLYIVIVVNRHCDVSNAISSEISMGQKLEWLENGTGNITIINKLKKLLLFALFYFNTEMISLSKLYFMFSYVLQMVMCISCVMHLCIK